jgi:hypothetical protein
MSYYNIAFQPLPLVLRFVELLEKQEVNKTNLLSKTDAIGWSYLMNSFAEKDSTRISYKDLLPIPDEQQTNKHTKTKDGYSQPTKETLQAISRLIDQKRIPRKVLLGLVGTGALEQL